MTPLRLGPTPQCPSGAAAGACVPGRGVQPSQLFLSLGRGRKPEQPGAELREERAPPPPPPIPPPARPPYVLVRLRPLRASPESPRRAAAAAAALAEGGGGGESPRLPRRQRDGGDRSGHPAADHQAAEPE